MEQQVLDIYNLVFPNTWIDQGSPTASFKLRMGFYYTLFVDPTRLNDKIFQIKIDILKQPQSCYR